jgi:hypothetical protein
MNLEDELIQLCLGADEPASLLLTSGRFPDRWVDKYLRLMERAMEQWGTDKNAPRKAVAAIHFASTYLHLRYWSWSQSNGRENKATDEALSRIRTQSELWLLGPLGGAAPFEN